MSTEPDHNKTGPTDITSVFLNLESGLRRFLMRFFVRPQDIEDAVQETFLRAYESEQKQTIRAPKAFLYKVAENLALSEISRKAHQLMDYVGDFSEMEVLDDKPSLIEDLMQQERLANISAAIATLPPQCRRVMVMRKVFGFSHKEIAVRLEISVKTVENHLNRGLQRCQETLAATSSERAGVDPDGLEAQVGRVVREEP
ncbi:MAG: RNA polymerase sigma factor [Gammaproteobacteria bacterium]|jgi:RNA polymerase sigma factor (sigma-70 family)|nr:MAG: RNA polymerase sigma factor [Gammaproteobacteria bacterium]